MSANESAIIYTLVGAGITSLRKQIRLKVQTINQVAVWICGVKIEEKNVQTIGMEDPEVSVRYLFLEWRLFAHIRTERCAIPKNYSIKFN